MKEVVRLQDRPGDNGLHSLVLVNASEHLRTLRIRGQELGLELALADEIGPREGRPK